MNRGCAEGVTELSNISRKVCFGLSVARRGDMNRSHVQMLLKKHGIRSKDFRNGQPSRDSKAN